MAYTIAQNTSFLTLASIFQKIFSSVYFFVVAYFIGETARGHYFTIFASIAIFTVIADFGFGSVLTREISKQLSEWQKYFLTAFFTKIVFGFGAFGLLLLSKYIFNYPAQSIGVVLVAGIVLFFDNLQNTIYGVFRAHKNLLYESIGLVGAQILTLVIGSLALFFHQSLLWLLLAFAIPYFLSMLYGLICLVWKYKLCFKFYFDKPTFLIFFKLAIPFAVAGIVGRLYIYSDSIIMNTYVDPVQIGWWSIAFKITYVFQLLPVALSASMYPVISAEFLKNQKRIVKLFEKAYHYLLLFSLPITFGIFFIAEAVFRNLFPKFLLAVPTLRILIVSIIFSFLSLIHGAMLNASGKQAKQTISVIISLVVSVILNIWLIPKYGIKGAAFTSVISSMVLYLIGCYFVVKNFSINSKKIFFIFIKLFFPTCIMSLFIWFIGQKVHFLITICFASLIYVVCLFVTGGLSKELIAEFRLKIFGKKSISYETIDSNT